MVVEILRLRTKTPISKMKPPEFSSSGEDPESAFKGDREVLRREEKISSSIYEWDRLQSGNVIEGPAIIEGSDNTYIVPRGWQFGMDSFQNGVLERRE
jgi:N-methylhydantoinase A/acetophenone carboxylase